MSEICTHISDKRDLASGVKYIIPLWKVVAAIRHDEASPCISTTRNPCKDEEGCLCLSLANAAVEAMREHLGQVAA